MQGDKLCNLFFFFFFSIFAHWSFVPLTYVYVNKLRAVMHHLAFVAYRILG